MHTFKLLLATLLIALPISEALAAKLIPGNSNTPAASSVEPKVNVAASPVAQPAPPPVTPAPAAPRPATIAPAAVAPRAAPAIATGFYMGAQLGDSSVGAVMGYQFTKMFGMEVTYDYFDPIYTRATTTTIAEKNRLGGSALVMFPVKFSDMGPMALFIKFGYARTIDKVTTDDPGIPPSIPASSSITTTTRTGVTGGGGVHVDMSQNSSVRLGVNVVGAERTTFLVALYRF